MAEIINLRNVRKAKARAEKNATAEGNRVAYGRNKAEKSLSKAQQKLSEKKLSAHKLDQERE